MKRDTDKCKEIKVTDKTINIPYCGLPLRPVVLLTLLLSMLMVFINTVVIGQTNLTFFDLKYPNCGIKDQTKIYSMNVAKN